MAELGFELRQSMARIQIQNYYSILLSFVLSGYTGVPFQNNYCCLLVPATVLGPWEGQTLYKIDWLID